VRIEDDNLLKMFFIVNPDMLKGRGDFRAETIDPDDWESEKIVSLYQDGLKCWHQTGTEILFNYVTKDWGDE